MVLPPWTLRESFFNQAVHQNIQSEINFGFFFYHSQELSPSPLSSISFLGSEKFSIPFDIQQFFSVHNDLYKADMQRLSGSLAALAEIF